MRLVGSLDKIMTLAIVAATAVFFAGCSGGAGVGLSAGGGGTGGKISNTAIAPTLSISPTFQVLYTRDSFSFSASGGNAPYTFSLVSGVGSISSDGAYSAPTSPGSAVVRVTDSGGVSMSANIIVLTRIAISPVAVTVVIGGSATFTASSGTAPYVFSVVGGGGSVNAATGAYTAPGVPGTAVVRVTDAKGAMTDAIVTVNPPVAISPGSKTLAVNDAFTFSAAGGVPPYSYSLQAGGGAVVASSGLYTAPNATGTATVRVTDSQGYTSDATITINPALAISPTTKTIAVNNQATFSAAGGVAPYSFSVIAGGGSVNVATGVYTAPNAAGTATVRVTDSFGNTSSAAVTINPALAISPATKTVAVNNSATFSASGGVGPYSYSVAAGGGSVNAATGVYTAPAAAGPATLRVTDSLGNTSSATVTINGALAISPASKTIAVNNQLAFSATGGVAPFTYSVQAGGG